MRKWLLLLGSFLGMACFTFAEDILLESKGTSGDSARAIKTVVNYDNESGDDDVMPLYLCNESLATLTNGTEVDFKIGDQNQSTCWKGWASLDGVSNDANTLKSWVANGYTINVSQTLDFPCAAGAIPELANATFMPGIKNSGLHTMEARTDKNVLVPVILQTAAQIKAVNSSQKLNVSVIHFAMFTIKSVTDSGSNKYVTMIYNGLIPDDYFFSKRVDYRGSVEVQPK